MALEALLFDVDGTLADTERDGHRPAFNLAFAEHGLGWDWDAALYGQLLAVTGGKERIRYYTDRFLTPDSLPADFDALVTQLHQAKTRHYTRMLSEGAIPLRPGVRRLLQEARTEGLRLAVVTTTTPENVTALLEHNLAPDAASWFEVIAAGDIVPAKKPAADIYHWALNEMNLKPEQCLAFEDSEHGLAASLGAGVRTLVTVNGYTVDHDFAGALAVLSDLGEPEAPLRQLQGEPMEGGYVDLAQLRQWFAQAQLSTAGAK